MIRPSKEEPIGIEKGAKGRMRALSCLCGKELRAENDYELSERAYGHVDSYHPELRLGQERLRAIVASVAYDEEPSSGSLARAW
jgi:hypothetical protein